MNPIKALSQSTATTATHQVAYFDLVQETLDKEWDLKKDPIKAKDKDLDAAIGLLAQIAFETIVEESIQQSNTKSLQQKVVKETAFSTEDKIHDFVIKNSFAFKTACETGFPFSSLHTPAVKGALNTVLKQGSIVHEFLSRECFEWMSEEELDNRFGEVFQNLKREEIGLACTKLKNAYLRDGDNKSGYYLLWFIKRVTYASFQIPKIEDFNKSSVSEVLSKHITKTFVPENLKSGWHLCSELDAYKAWVTIFLYRSNFLCNTFFIDFLDQKSRSNFLWFAEQQLMVLSWFEWPEKGNIIKDLLESLERKDRFQFVEKLCSSKCKRTRDFCKQLISEADPIQKKS